MIIVFVLLVVGPLLLLAGLGAKWARLERERLQFQFRELLAGKLRDIDGSLARVIQKNERELVELIRDPPAELDGLRERHPWVRQAFLLDPEGKLLFPDLRAPSAGDMAFIDRTREIWLRGELLRRRPGLGPAAQAMQMLSNQAVPMQGMDPGSAGEASGWYTWYWGSGLNLIYYHWLGDGRCLGVELDRVRLLADLIGQMPDTASRNDRLADGRIALRDSNGALLYQWGAYAYQANEKQAAAQALSAPLQSWRLEYYAPASLFAAAGGLAFSYVAGFAAVALALIGLAVYFYRESTRELRLAGQRVSFVNQVSHELKTPLTNVRLYAELLQQHLDGEDETAQRHLNIVVEECGRLSRLIGNVLTFGRSQRGALTIHPTPGRVDEIIQRVLDGYRPALERRGIRVQYSPGKATQVMVAADVVEQIVGNLLSNIEKYAAAGGVAEIASEQRDGMTLITVADHGPGIPAAERENVFRPFYRLSAALHDGAAGTGIGLPIARDLARRHGGDLKVVAAEKGAAFEVRLATPEAVEMERG